LGRVPQSVRISRSLSRLQQAALVAAEAREAGREHFDRLHTQVVEQQEARREHFDRLHNQVLAQQEARRAMLVRYRTLEADALRAKWDDLYSDPRMQELLRIFGAMIAVVSRARDDQEKDSALDRLVGRIKWRLYEGNPKDRAAKQALARLAEKDGVEPLTKKRQALKVGLLWALSYRDEPRQYRFGRWWLTGGDGKKIAVAPDRLVLRQTWEWLQNEAINLARAWLLDASDRTYVRRSSAANPESDAAPAEPEPAALDALLSPRRRHVSG
jgi:hypothetical protein